MTITSVQLLPRGETQWRLIATSDDPDAVFRFFISGEEAGENETGLLDFATLPGEYPVVEVLDDPSAEPGLAWPCSMLLSWQRQDGPLGAGGEVASYRIEQWDGADWVLVDEIPEDGQNWHQWRTGVLEDSQSHRFQVTPVGVNGNEGDPQVFEALMVRHPDPPAVTFSYDEDAGTVTIEEAA